MYMYVYIYIYIYIHIMCIRGWPSGWPRRKADAGGSRHHNFWLLRYVMVISI